MNEETDTLLPSQRAALRGPHLNAAGQSVNRCVTCKNWQPSDRLVYGRCARCCTLPHAEPKRRAWMKYEIWFRSDDESGYLRYTAARTEEGAYRSMKKLQDKDGFRHLQLYLRVRGEDGTVTDSTYQEPEKTPEKPISRKRTTVLDGMYLKTGRYVRDWRYDSSRTGNAFYRVQRAARMLRIEKHPKRYDYFWGFVDGDPFTIDGKRVISNRLVRLQRLMELGAEHKLIDENGAAPRALLELVKEGSDEKS